MGDVNCYGTAPHHPENPFVADKKGGMQCARGRNFTLLLPFSR